MAYYAVDRIEGDRVILVADDGTTIEISRRHLPRGVREGSVLSAETDGSGRPDWATVGLDEAERARRLQRARETMDRLRARDPGGDVTL